MIRTAFRCCLVAVWVLGCVEAEPIDDGIDAEVADASDRSDARPGDVRDASPARPDGGATAPDAGAVDAAPPRDGRVPTTDGAAPVDAGAMPADGAAPRDAGGPRRDLGAPSGDASVAPRDGGPSPACGPGATEGCGPLERCLDGACQAAYPDQRVGIFYLVWHSAAADAMRAVPPGERQVIEDVIRDPGRSASALLEARGLYQRAGAFHYHAEPTLGFYSLYRPRPGEAGQVEAFDAAPIAATHARQLTEAGVDFVYVDLTNLPGQGDFTDLIGLRPFEVLFEEWRRVRDAGGWTPQIAAWVPMPTLAVQPEPRTIHPVIDLYRDPRFDDLVLRDPRSGRKVLFATVNGLFDLDRDLEAQLEGAGDIVVVPMWGNLDPGTLQGGTLSWQQPCRAPGPPDGSLQPTTLVSNTDPCLQAGTPQSDIGSALSVSASYQLGYASLPMQAAGKRGGQTLQRQFETAFEMQPDWLLINAWNEWVAQPQSNAGVTDQGPLLWSMGTERGDASDRWLWVDMYGLEYVRDLEPTVQEGDRWYRLLQSCVRAYRAGGCDQAPGEACCDVRPSHHVVWSLRLGAGDATTRPHLLTRDFNEVSALTGAPGWTQVCNPYFAPPSVCGANPPFSGDLPFQLFTEPGPGRVALYRCLAAGHFFSPDAGCEGQVQEGLLGYVADTRTSAMARPLSRCYHLDARVHFHWLEATCPPGNIRHEGVLGFVR